MPDLVLGCGNQPCRKSGCSLGDIVLRGWALPLALRSQGRLCQTWWHIRTLAREAWAGVEEINDMCGKRKCWELWVGWCIKPGLGGHMWPLWHCSFNVTWQGLGMGSFLCRRNRACKRPESGSAPGSKHGHSGEGSLNNKEVDRAPQPEV